MLPVLANTLLSSRRLRRSGDPHAANIVSAILGAGGVLSLPERVAIDGFVKTLKITDNWSCNKAMWGFAGQVAAAHQLDWMDPFSGNPLTFIGGLTHTASGSTGKQPDGYADTGIVVSSIFTTANTGVSDYIVSAPNSSYFFDFDGITNFGIQCEGPAGLNFDTNYSSGRMGIGGRPQSGFLQCNRTGLNLAKGYQDGIEITSTTASLGTFSTNTMKMFTLSGGIGDTDETRGFSSLHDSRSPSQAAAYASAVLTLMAAFGR